MGFHIDAVAPTTDWHWQGITRHPTSQEFFYISKGGTNDGKAGLFTVMMEHNFDKATYVGNSLMSAGKEAAEVDSANNMIVDEQLKGEN